MKQPMARSYWRAAVLAVFLSSPAIAGMDLVIEADRDTYVLGEPVGVTLRAENNSPDPVEASVVLTPEAGFVQLFVSDAGGVFKQYFGPGWGIRDVFLRPETIAPGGRREFHIDLLWHHVVPGDDEFLRREFVFEEPGCYKVRAKTLLPSFNGESNTIEICISSPRGADLAVWESFVDDPEIARFVQRPLPDVPLAVRDRAQALLDQYPSSTVAPYIRTALDSTNIQAETPLEVDRGRKSVGPSPADRQEMTTVIYRCLGALERRDVTGCSELLSKRFVYDGNFDRRWFIDKLEGDFAEIPSGSLSIRATALEFDFDDRGRPRAEFDIEASLDGQPTPDESNRVRLDFVRKGGRWRIASWAKVD